MWSTWLAHLYVFCKGGEGEVGGHSFSLPGAPGYRARSLYIQARNTRSSDANLGFGGRLTFAPFLKWERRILSQRAAPKELQRFPFRHSISLFLHNSLYFTNRYMR